MEEKNFNSHHRIIVSDREVITLTGVTDVISFDEENVIVETEMGVLEIKGNDLHVNKLNLENGEMDLTGEINCLEYNDKLLHQKSASLLSKIFG